MPYDQRHVGTSSHINWRILRGSVQEPQVTTRMCVVLYERRHSGMHLKILNNFGRELLFGRVEGTLSFSFMC